MNKIDKLFNEIAYHSSAMAHYHSTWYAAYNYHAELFIKVCNERDEILEKIIRRYMMGTDYKPKLSIELTPTQQEGLQAISLPWGWQRAFFSKVIDEVIELNYEFGARPIALIISDNVRPSDIIPVLHRARITNEE